MEKTELDRANEIALKEYLAPRTFCLAQMVNHRFNPFGSGILINIGERSFIFTAAHVFEEMKKFSNNLIRDTLLYQKTFYPKFPKVKEIGVVKETGDSNFDLGWVEIQKEIELENIALSLNDVFISDIEIETDGALLTGFPRDLIDPNKFLENKETALKFLVYRTCFSKDQEENKNTTGHVLIDYPVDSIDDKNGGFRKMPNPKGCSGGGIWMARKRNESVWNIANRVNLIGIDIEWRENGRTIKGTRLIHLLEFIKTIYPDLRQVIDERISAN